MAKYESGYQIKAKAFVPVDYRDELQAYAALTRLNEIGAEVKKLLGEGSTFETEFIKRRPKKEPAA